jgi:hypothetical protein
MAILDGKAKMKIYPNGHSQYQNSFVTKMAIDMINQQEQSEIKAEDFSPTKTDKHTIELSRLAFDGDLPEGVTAQFWTDAVIARKLQRF